jgi:SAM-dependent methyltransferase
MNPTDYHDYVIKDGKLIGDFEGMYQNSIEIPWHQNRERLSDTLLMELLANISQYNSICEVGCGLGYFTERLSRRFTDAHITGFDISNKAIEKAKDRLPCWIDLAQLDITKEYRGKYDCVVVKEILWYVFPYLSDVLNNVENMLEENGILCIAQSFPPNTNYVGVDTIHSPEHLIELIGNRFDVLFYGSTRCESQNFDLTVHIICKRRGCRGKLPQIPLC